MTRGKQDKQASKALTTLSVTNFGHEKNRVLNKQGNRSKMNTYNYKIR